MKKKIRHLYRLFRYKSYRNKLVNNKNVYEKQLVNFTRDYKTSTTKRLIVFIVPGLNSNTLEEKISGGVISIMSIAKETKLHFNDGKSNVIICTCLNEALIEKYRTFENDFNVYDYSFVEQFQELDEIIIHIPDFLILWFNKKFTYKNSSFLRKIVNVQINLMNQNITLMPQPSDINVLKELTTNITITTAHQQYCNQYFRNYFGYPLHKLSVWISPEQYYFKSVEDKENLLIYSPDDKPEKEAVLEKLRSIKGLELKMIKGISYEEYKVVISKAKWALTFGEGLDGYIIEPIFSGAIGFAVYNENFFTEDFKALKTVYKSYDDLIQNIVEDINQFQNKVSDYQSYQQIQFDTCKAHYSTATYKNNIARFYKKEYTFP